jgi:hypothetical protein
VRRDAVELQFRDMRNTSLFRAWNDCKVPWNAFAQPALSFQGLAAPSSLSDHQAQQDEIMELMSKTKPAPFECPHCKAKYDIVRMEALPVEADTEITCIGCGGPLTGREGPFLLKYFLVSRRQGTRAAAGGDGRAEYLERQRA